MKLPWCLVVVKPGGTPGRPSVLKLALAVLPGVCCSLVPEAYKPIVDGWMHGNEYVEG